MRDHLVSFEENQQQMELDGSGELPSEIPVQLDGREIPLDGNNGKVGPREGQLKERGKEERIWEILNANRLKQCMC